VSTLEGWDGGETLIRVIWWLSRAKFAYSLINRPFRSKSLKKRKEKRKKT
jgi:hypothetical protein